MNVRILATVSRSFKEWSTMRAALTTVYERYPLAILDHGDCDPGDVQAAGMWQGLGGIAHGWPADWAHCDRGCRPDHRKRRRNGDWYCPSAGLRRDVEMVERAPALVLAFLDPQSRTRGAFRTADMAEEAGIPVVRYLMGVGS